MLLTGICTRTVSHISMENSSFVEKGLVYILHREFPGLGVEERRLSLTQLDEVPNGAHDQEPEANCLANLQEFSLVGYRF